MGRERRKKKKSGGLSGHALLEIAGEVMRGERPRSDLAEHGIEIGPAIVGDEAKALFLADLGVPDSSDPKAPDHVRAHGHSWNNRAEVLASTRCGCFDCLATFAPREIAVWAEEGQTALCPRCGKDAIVGSKSGFPIDEPFLRRMHDCWFDIPKPGRR